MSATTPWWNGHALHTKGVSAEIKDTGLSTDMLSISWAKQLTLYESDTSGVSASDLHLHLSIFLALTVPRCT
jgi:hypothetical protein